MRKTDRQSAHDGKIVKMPLEPDPAYLYQKLIDNRISIDTICDIRLPIFLGEIPLVFLKSRSIEGTFEYADSKVLNYWVDIVEKYLSQEEISLVKEFCDIIGLDIGEIDTLRDNSTGKLYIIDVNNIPGGNVFVRIKNGKKVEHDLALFLGTLL